MLSAEKEDFLREILIDADHTFQNLHDTILNNLDFDQSQLASFFEANEEWERCGEITLMKMDESQDVQIMSETKVSECINAKGDKLVYVFDMFGNRGFFIEVLNVSDSRKLAEPSIIKAEGETPEQILLEDVNMDEVANLFDLNDNDLDDDFDELDSIFFDDLNEEDYSELF